MNIDTSRRPRQHGEMLLMPVLGVAEGKTVKVSKQVIAHSESGAHHVVMSPTDFEVTTVRNSDGTETLYLSMPESGSLVHNKTGPDAHKTLPVDAGDWVVLQKNEWDPFTEIVRKVAD